MKKYLLRKFFFLLLIVLAVPSLWAQQIANFQQRGRAILSLSDNRPSASHPSLPIGQEVIVENARTGNYVWATITGRAESSINGIVALTIDIWQALDLNASDDVILTVPYRQQGKVALSLSDGGIHAVSHPSLPIGQLVSIKNVRNGIVLEAVIANRISTNINGIIALTISAWQALDLNVDDEVILTLIQ